MTRQNARKTFGTKMHNTTHSKNSINSDTDGAFNAEILQSKKTTKNITRYMSVQQEKHNPSKIRYTQGAWSSQRKSLN
jgi:hypothetical protein